MSLIVKTATPIPDEGPMRLEEKVAKGTTIRMGDEIFVWTAETQGGVGLIARGEVVEVNSAAEDRRQIITIRPISRNPLRPYTNSDLARHEYRPGPRPSQTPAEITLFEKIQKYSLNRCVALDDKEATFLRGRFE